MNFRILKGKIRNLIVQSSKNVGASQTHLKLALLEVISVDRRSGQAGVKESFHIGSSDAIASCTRIIKVISLLGETVNPHF
ncbi:hypothetical protein LEP3755_13430 [Leptolyngbya sp. NIES-3755]|nr:hypothetical protein LEP3755_13430 [Leptolyngbya sp. NIES-3755]